MYVLNNRSDLLPCKLDVLTLLIWAWRWCYKPHMHRSLGVIHTSPRISIRSPASENQHSMLVLHWSFFDGWSGASFFLIWALPKMRSKKRSFRSEMLSENSRWRKGRDETNNPRRKPSSSSLYSLLDTLSYVYYISTTQRSFSLIFGFPKGLSNLYILQKFHEETHFIEKDMIESLSRSNT